MLLDPTYYMYTPEELELLKDLFDLENTLKTMQKNLVKSRT